jgi:hypothetical protein
VRQFDVVENANAATRRYAPYFVILQSHHLEPLETVLVAPLVNDLARAMDQLNLRAEIKGETLLVAMPEMAGIPRSRLGRPVASLATHEDAFRRP